MAPWANLPRVLSGLLDDGGLAQQAVADQRLFCALLLPGDEQYHPCLRYGLDLVKDSQAVKVEFIDQTGIPP